MTRRPLNTTLFPYTTLFRSDPLDDVVRVLAVMHHHVQGERPAGRHRPPELLGQGRRSEEHTSELQSHSDLVCRLLLEKKKGKNVWAIKASDRFGFAPEAHKR